MQKIALLIFTGLFALSSAPFVNAVDAAPLSDSQISIIRANCQVAQSTMQLVQQSDVATRLSRGRDYEQLLKVMAIFNSRVALNKLDAASLTATTADFEKKFRIFQKDYIGYSEQLSRAISMRCQEQPVTFYDQLTAVRESRALLATEINEMDKLLDNYQKSLDVLQAAVAEAEKSADS